MTSSSLTIISVSYKYKLEVSPGFATNDNFWTTPHQLPSLEQFITEDSFLIFNILEISDDRLIDWLGLTCGRVEHRSHQWHLQTSISSVVILFWKNSVHKWRRREGGKSDERLNKKLPQWGKVRTIHYTPVWGEEKDQGKQKRCFLERDIEAHLSHDGLLH